MGLFNSCRIILLELLRKNLMDYNHNFLFIKYRISLERKKSSHLVTRLIIFEKSVRFFIKHDLYVIICSKRQIWVSPLIRNCTREPTPVAMILMQQMLQWKALLFLLDSPRDKYSWFSRVVVNLESCTMRR